MAPAVLDYPAWDPPADLPALPAFGSPLDQSLWAPELGLPPGLISSSPSCCGP